MSIKRPALVGNFYAPGALTNSTETTFDTLFDDAKITLSRVLFLVFIQKCVAAGWINKEGFYQLIIRPGFLRFQYKLYYLN